MTNAETPAVPIDAEETGRTDSAADQPAEEGRPFQFTLRQMLLWVAAISLLLGLLASFRLLIENAREAARASSCIGRLSQLGSALHNYHDYYGCFPPAYVCDANGKPMHSWRVLLLPFMEEQGLYSQYNFFEPWDGPKNRRLAAASPWLLDSYHCNSGDLKGRGKPLTDFVAIVGDNTMWPGERCMRRVWPGEKYTVFESRDWPGPQQIMVIEIANSDIHWMEPRDLTFEQALAGIQPEKGLGIGSNHPRGIIYVNARGTAEVLDRDIDPEELRRMLTVEPDDRQVEIVP